MDKERLLSYFKGVSAQYLVVLYLVLLLAAGFVLSTMVLLPQEQRIDALALQLKAEQQKVAVVESFILSNPDTGKHLSDLNLALQKVEKALPGSMDLSHFLQQLERDAKAAGVRLVNVKPSALADRAGYREMPIELTVEGSYYSTLSFLKKLEDGERFSLPASFLIQRKQDKLSTRLNLQIFCYGVTPKPAAPLPAAAPPGLPAALAPLLPPAR